MPVNLGQDTMRQVFLLQVTDEQAKYRYTFLILKGLQPKILLRLNKFQLCDGFICQMCVDTNGSVCSW